MSEKDGHSIKSRIGKPQLEERPRPSVDYGCYGVCRNDKPFAVSLKLIFRDGSSQYLFYHELLSPMEFDGSSTIELTTHTRKIIVKGRELGVIADFISEHRLVWLKEHEGSFIGEEMEGGFVEAISIKEI